MERARLILDYIKALIWPLIAVVIILLFHQEVAERIKNITDLEAGPVKAKMSGSGKETSDQVKGKAPDIWFAFLPLPSSLSECENKARAALQNNGFPPQGESGSTFFYGYKEDYVGAIWCSESPRQALITVSGPDRNTARDAVSKLSEVFGK